MLSLLTPQTLRLAIIVAVTGLMAFGYYLQYVEGLEPCPLCITQRFFLILAAALALVAVLHNPQRIGTRVYSALGTLFAIVGAYFSSRQLYLQSLPEDQVPACGPSIEFVLETFPLAEALQILLRGDGNCAEVTWQFLGLSIPGWTLLAFIGLGLTWIAQSLIKSRAGDANSQ